MFLFIVLLLINFIDFAKSEGINQYNPTFYGHSVTLAFYSVFEKVVKMYHFLY